MSVLQQIILIAATRAALAPRHQPTALICRERQWPLHIATALMRLARPHLPSYTAVAARILRQSTHNHTVVNAHFPWLFLPDYTAVTL